MVEVASKATVEALVRRATAGRAYDRSKILKPSALWKLMNCPWSAAMDLHGPPEERVDETTPYDRARMEGGTRFEKEWVRRHYPDALEIAAFGLDGLHQTIEAMVRGVPAILHPVLAALRHDIAGKGDLLVRDDSGIGKAALSHGYRLKELKKATKVAPYHALQAGAYGLALEEMLGPDSGPVTLDVVLPDGEHPVALDDVRQDLLAHVDGWREIRDGTFRPELPGFDQALSPWRVYANRLLVERKDVTQIAGFTARTRRKLREELGVKDLNDLGRLQLGDFKRIFSEEKAVRRYYQARSFSEKRPLLLPGKVLKIPRNTRRIFFDIETSDSVHPTEPPHCYMLGLLEDGEYRSFVARGAADEERMFTEFLKHIGNPRKVSLLHWTGFEVGILEGAASRYPKLAGKLARVIDACVDLYRIVKDALVLPVSNYSIKSCAVVPCFGGFAWRQQGVDGLSSMTLYWDWLAGAGDQTIQSVLRYNEDDVRALEAVIKGLRRANFI